MYNIRHFYLRDINNLMSIIICTNKSSVGRNANVSLDMHNGCRKTAYRVFVVVVVYFSPICG